MKPVLLLLVLTFLSIILACSSVEKQSPIQQTSTNANVSTEKPVNSSVVSEANTSLQTEANTSISSEDAKPESTPKFNKCKKCLEWSGLESVKKDEKGNCLQWKERCLQWETYPC